MSEECLHPDCQVLLFDISTLQAKSKPEVDFLRLSYTSILVITIPIKDTIIAIFNELP